MGTLKFVQLQMGTGKLVQRWELSDLPSEIIARDVDCQTCPANYSYRWGLSELPSEIIATDVDCQTCPGKLQL